MRELLPNNGLPEPQGLYHPQNEHDACGVGFVVGRFLVLGDGDRRKENPRRYESKLPHEFPPAREAFDPAAMRLLKRAPHGRLYERLTDDRRSAIKKCPGSREPGPALDQ